MKIRGEFVKRTIAGETFLVPIGDAAKQYSGLFALNELGAFIWDLLPDAVDGDAIVDRVLDTYDVTRREACADVEEFLAKLREMNIL